MRDLFLTSEAFSLMDSVKSLIAPPVSSPQERIALFSERRRVCAVAMVNGPVELRLFEGYDRLYRVRRAVQTTTIEAAWGMATDESGFEYEIGCSAELGITIRDDPKAIDRAIRDFDAEYELFTRLVKSSLRSEVRQLIRTERRMHARLDSAKCRAAFEQADSIFEVAQVYQATYGDPNWKGHIARSFLQQEVEQDARHKQALANVEREKAFMRASASLVELQQEYAAKAENFRRSLERDEAEHKIEKARLAIEKLGREEGLALIDAVTYGLIASHRERMSETEKQALAKFNADLVAILKTPRF